ncbi:uncharacterized protein LOC141627746 [Silene latifolia]|uniref:uncharacterized protein LOC141627746 n=1 Tax=Silene latifolia TaxID=37657 RepID=UPI003D784040
MLLTIAKKCGVGSVLVNNPPRVGVGTSGSALLPTGVMHNIGFRNVRGLNSPSKQKQVKWFLQSHMVGLFGLLETKVKPLSLNSVRKNVCDGWSVSTNSSYHPGGRDPQTRVYSRLDRVLINHLWTQYRPNAYAHFYNEGTFDHTPCIIQEPDTSMKGKRSFKYFNMWSQVPDFKPCISHHWNHPWQGTKMFKVVMKLKSLKRPLKELNKALFDDIENSAVHAWKILDNIQDQLRSAPGDPALLIKEKEAAGVYRELQAACDSFLLQKSKATWINQGDNNTRYFHSLLRTRRVKNKIFLIEDRPICTSSIIRIVGPVTKKEIKEAFFSIPNHKAPGPDGFSSAFFKDSWSVVGDEDIVRLYNRKTVSPRCLMKIDLKKAYDSVHWEFVKQMLIALNFPTKFIHLVMLCVSTASYSLVLNGENFGYFKGAKGLRQGDPISPLLFTITMEYLSRILAHVTDTMPFKFHPLCSQLKLSHLMFADDLLLFSKGDTTSIMILLRAFATFSVATGLQMNSLKSNIYFNGVASRVKSDILQISGFSEGALPFKYLGVPISHWEAHFVKKRNCLIEKILRTYSWLSCQKIILSLVD